MRHSVKVYMWGIEIGTLSSDTTGRPSFFYFSPALPDEIKAAFPVGFPADMLAGKLPVYGENRPPYDGVPPFISDSLPDSWGNELFEQWRTANKISNREISACDKLAFIGVRGMGALEFQPQEAIRLKNDHVDISAIADLAERILLEREDAIISPDEELTMKALIAVGSSVGGRQAKALLAISRKDGSIRSGQIAGLKDHDYCIVKFDMPERDTARTEYVFYRLALDCGIDMMPSQLLAVENRNHFLTKRFDRDSQGGKLHVQTLAAMSPDADSYEALFELARALKLPYEAMEQLFRRMVFNIIGNNTDDHHKNFSFIMNRAGHWSLSPAYDMTFIYDTGGWRGNTEHCMTVGGCRRNISKETVLAFAESNGIKDAARLIDGIAAEFMRFREVATEGCIRPEWIARMSDAIEQNLERWGYLAPIAAVEFETSDGHMVAQARIEMAYRSGSFHLLADIDGRPCKYVINKACPEYESLLLNGIRSFDEGSLHAMISRYLLKNNG